MRQRDEIALLLVGIATGAAVGAAIGLVVSALVKELGYATFYFAAFGSYIGMLIADRRRIALRRAAAARAAQLPPPKPAAKGRQARR